MNNVLSRSVGSFGAVSVNFAVGTACVLAVTFLLAGGIEEGRPVAWYYWVLGGVAGAVYVTVALIAVREVGAGGVTAATIAGQLALAVLVDRLGVFGLEERAITWDKVVGIVLLATGVLLVVRE